ncbi:MAG TPA: AI-2E family transporter [Vicinamibacterales bacterium]|nr:AI-2E family transporter [Vicinamibacterales bacterium]
MTADETNRVIRRSVITAIVGVAIALGIYAAREVLMTLYFSALLAIGLSPAVRILERSRWVDGRRRRIPRWLAILALYIAFLVIVVLILAMVVPPLVQQLQQFIVNLPTYADEMQSSLIARGVMKPGTSWSDFFSNMEGPSMALTSLYSVLQLTVGALGQILTILLMPFYLLLESHDLHNWMLALVKPEHQPRVDRIMRSVTHKVGAWLSGQLLLAGIVAVAATIAFKLIGVPYFYVLGLLAALGEFVPVIGPLLAAIPAVLLGWTISPQTALLVAAYSSIQQFIESNVLVPRIMERQVGVSPVSIIVALLLGSSLLGLVGAILSVPTAAIVQVIIRERFEYKKRTEGNDGN